MSLLHIETAEWERNRTRYALFKACLFARRVRGLWTAAESRGRSDLCPRAPCELPNQLAGVPHTNGLAAVSRT